MKSFLSGLVGLTLTAVYAVAMNPGMAPKDTTHAFTPEELEIFQQREAKSAQLEGASRSARSFLAAHGCSTEYASFIARGAISNGLPVRVVSSVVFVESTCRPSAVSTKGAVGLMQVNARVWHENTESLKDPDYNIQVGTRVLGSYVHRYGLREGLHRYNGMGRGCSTCDEQYVAKVIQ